MLGISSVGKNDKIFRGKIVADQGARVPRASPKHFFIILMQTPSEAGSLWIWLPLSR